MAAKKKSLPPWLKEAQAEKEMPKTVKKGPPKKGPPPKGKKGC
jgi:hypothetical protein